MFLASRSGLNEDLRIALILSKNVESELSY